MNSYTYAGLSYTLLGIRKRAKEVKAYTKKKEQTKKKNFKRETSTQRTEHTCEWTMAKSKNHDAVAKQRDFFNGIILYRVRSVRDSGFPLPRT